MPELPEVEVLRSQLEVVLVGAKIRATRATHPRYRARGVAGSVITSVHRRGKYLLLELDDSRNIVLHLGMTGQLLFENLPDDHVHLRVFTDRGALYFRDTRRFGSAYVLGVGELPKGIYRSLGQEPLERRFDVGRAAVILDGLGGPLKTRLLSQRAIAGVGNYIADEALHKSGLLPMRREAEIDQLQRLVRDVQIVVKGSVRLGGVSERDYKHLTGGRGAYQDRLRCYGRAGLPCHVCRTPLSWSRVGGRGSTYCLRCQH
jgi:formamidopyrimidine-DNA glycosylase